MINKLFKVPSQTLPIKPSDTIMVSDELKNQLEEFDEESINLFEKKGKIIIIKYKFKNENDVLIGTLRGLGLTIAECISLECNIEQQKAIIFFNQLQNKQVEIFGIDIQIAQNIIEFLPESEIAYNILKCNLYDISIQCDECTLILTFKNI